MGNDFDGFAKHCMSGLGGTKPQYNLSNKVAEDEFFCFQQSLTMEKVLSPLVLNPSTSDHALPISHSELDGEPHFLHKQLQQQQQQQQRSGRTPPHAVAPSVVVDHPTFNAYANDFDDDDDVAHHMDDVDGVMGFGADGPEEHEVYDYHPHHLFINNHAPFTGSSMSQQGASKRVAQPVQQQQQYTMPTSAGPKRFCRAQNSQDDVGSVGGVDPFEEGDNNNDGTAGINVMKCGNNNISDSGGMSPSSTPTNQIGRYRNYGIGVTPTDTASTSTTPVTTETWLATQPKLNAKSKSGYILFSAEVRKRVMHENPEAGFGEVSKIVGIEWKRLSTEQKRQYESRAQFIAEERAKAALLTPSNKSLQPGQIYVYCCRWQQCDFQFDSQEGLTEHVWTSHTQQMDGGVDNPFACLWNSCLKYRRESKPFPAFARLKRHLKERHLNTAARAISPKQRTKNFFIYLPPPPTANGHSTSASKNITGVEAGGRFVHHPYGKAPPNPMPCRLASPNGAMLNTGGPTPSTSSSNNNNTGFLPSTTSLAAALSQPPVSSTISTPSTTTRFLSTPKSSLSSYSQSHGNNNALLNGALPPNSTAPTPATSGSRHHHYVVQSSGGGFHQESHLPPTQQPQPSTAQKAIVVNGITVMIPANAQTVILPPGYLGPQQTQQIILHTASSAPPPPLSSVQQQQQQQQHALNGAGVPPHQQQHFQPNQQQQIVVQQQQPQMPSSSSISAAKQQFFPSTSALINGMPPNATVQQVLNGGTIAGQSTTAVVSHLQQQLQHAQVVQQQSQFQSSAAAHVQPSLSTTTVATAALSQQLPGTSSHAAANASTTMVQQQQHQLIIDPGRTVVNAVPKMAEPVFVEPSTSAKVQRVLHSEAYVRYIESMYSGVGGNKAQRTVSKWDKNLQATQRNTTSSTSVHFGGISNSANRRQLAQDWIRLSSNGSKHREEELMRALWKLRDQLIEGTTGIARHAELPADEPPTAPSSSCTSASGSSNSRNKAGGSSTLAEKKGG
ncbi:Protein polybromo-1 [Globodera pallida]|nr:Protein polybromo-1 [Globodera pallida]